ncbi:DUF4405 domain-containing protein [Geobacillus thermoleovorans]|uniref:DUF4405 domain-containing protein n=1 Tax=Geobacillus thermoleovorans TaxID=33941 RepID=UPI00345B5526
MSRENIFSASTTSFTTVSRSMLVHLLFFDYTTWSRERKLRFEQLLFVSMPVFIISGVLVLISRVVFPNVAIQGNHFVGEMHRFVVDATVSLVGLHIGVHWQWIMVICRQAFRIEGKWRKGSIAVVFCRWLYWRAECNGLRRRLLYDGWL